MPGIPCLKTSKGMEQQNLELRYFSTTGPLSHFYYLIMVTYFGWLYVMTLILVTISASVIVGFSVSIFQHTKTRYPCHIQRSIWFPFNRLNFFLCYYGEYWVRRPRVHIWTQVFSHANFLRVS